MFKFILIFAIAAGGIVAWALYEAPEVTFFKQFYEHLAREHYSEAHKMIKADSDAEDQLEEAAREVQTTTMPGETRMVSYHGIEYVEKSPGALEISASVTRQIDPPGVTSAFGKVPVDYAVKLTCEKKGDTWQVVSFSDRCLSDRRRDE